MGFVFYLAVGLVATGVHFGVLVALVEGAGTAATVATAVGAVAGSVTAFVGNASLTFGQKSVLWNKTLPKFMLVALAGALLNATIIWGVVNAIGWHYIEAQIVATCVVVVCTYQVNRRWTFGL